MSEPRRQMPREAIRAIAYMGFFLALSSLFIAYYGFRMGFHPLLVGFNVATAAIVTFGSCWMLMQLRR
ncbi:MAG TPA: hypothetical protein V6D47_02760 [Oscillatoriaceae cyanobacterium]